MLSHHLVGQISDTTDQPTGPTSDAAVTPALVIWGTDVVVSETKDKFRKFITEFVDEELGAEEMGDGFDPLLPVYMQRLDEVKESCTNLCVIRAELLGPNNYLSVTLQIL